MLFCPWMASLATDPGCSPPAAQGARPQERLKSPFYGVTFLKKVWRTPDPRAGRPLPPPEPCIALGQAARAEQGPPPPHCCWRRQAGRWERPLRRDMGGQDLLLHPGGARGRAGSWPAELLSPLHPNRHRVPTRGKRSPLPHPSKIWFLLRYPEPLCCPAACHPPNPDTTWTHRSSDTFLVPTDGTSLPSTGSHPAQTHSVVTGRVTLCHPTARWDQRGPHNPRTQKRTAPSPAWHGTQRRTAAATEVRGDTAHAWPATVPSMSPDLEKQHPAALEGFTNNEQPQLPLLAPAPGQALPQQTLVINNISRHLPAALPARRTRCHLPSPKPRRCSPAPATHCDPAQAACSAEGHTAQPAQGIHSCLRGEETARRGSAGAAGMSRSPGEQRRDSHELFLALNDGRMLSPDPPCSTHSGHAPEQQLGSRSLGLKSIKGDCYGDTAAASTSGSARHPT